MFAFFGHSAAYYPFRFGEGHYTVYMRGVSLKAFGRQGFGYCRFCFAFSAFERFFYRIEAFVKVLTGNVYSVRRSERFVGCFYTPGR